jgi:hypothetical protein
MNVAAEPQESRPTYCYRPRMIGGEFVLTLSPDALEWAAGARSGRIPYRDVARLRLAFQPSNLMTKRCVAEIWPRGGSRLLAASTSVRSLFDSVDHGPEFRAFVTELVRRVGEAGATPRLEAGMAAWRWWPMAILAVFALGAALLLALRALFTGEATLGLAILGVGALFGWQVGSLVVRNRPQTFSPGAIPPGVLP